MRPESSQRGFGLVAALFVIVVIAAAIMTMAHLATTQSATNSMALQQARAYQMAQAGLEWGIARALSKSCVPSENFSLEGFTVAVTCVRSDVFDLPEESRGEGIKVSFRLLEATAQFAQIGSPDYAYRRLTAIVEVEESDP